MDERLAGDAGDGLRLPEFTRSLRGFATASAIGTHEHDLLFGPLIAARRSAARVVAAEAKAAAFDADRLRRALDEAVATIAKDRAGTDPAGRRALEACLEAAAAPLIGALAVLATASATLRAAQNSARAGAWAVWCGAVQAVFDATDAFWLVLDDVAPRSGGFRLPSAVVLLAISLALAASGAAAQHVTLRVPGVRADSLIAAGFDVVGTEPGAVLIVASPRDRARLVTQGVTEVRSSRGQLVVPGLANAQAVTAVYRSFDDPVRGVRAWTDSIVAANPRVTVDTIGRSFEGRPLLMFKIGPKGDSPQRPNAVFVATYHAREWAATETALRLVKYLAAPPGTDARRDSLVQSRDIWIMPVANPDGYQYTFSTNRLWRKTRSPQAGGAIGVDMNRNHSANWGLDNQGSSPDPQSEIYRGPAAMSESETRSIETWHLSHPPVVALSYHTYSGLVIYPPGAVYGGLAADLPVYKTLAGTNLRSAVTDRLSGSPRSSYMPGPGWMLYTTNGEYTDFASSKSGALAFTTELTSGYAGSGYYGFEFPDDPALLEQLFQDNLPFALDLLDAARDPAAFVSATTARRTSPLTVESASPEIRVIVPTLAATTTSIAANGPLTFRLDSTAGGKYTRRIISAPVARPAAFSVTGIGGAATFRLLAGAGAETADAGWTLSGFAPDSVFSKSGRYAWFGTSGTLQSPNVTVPADIDTVSLAFWTMHSGSGFTAEPSGRVDLSKDGGATWTTVGIQRGFAPVWYTDGVTIGGVRGKSIAFRFTANGLPWRLDEIAFIGHAGVVSTAVTSSGVLKPSENPVRSPTVRFIWPFGSSAGDLTVFDFSGREVWRRQMSPGDPLAWDVESLHIANGVYIAVAKSGSRSSRLKLFVARRSQ